MSAQYPILDNRPINKWKVVELKDELRRRNLPLKGLKDDLVRRLDESIRLERGGCGAETSKNLDYKSELVAEGENVQLHTKDVGVDDVPSNIDINTTSNVTDIVYKVDISGVPPEAHPEKVSKDFIVDPGFIGTVGELPSSKSTANASSLTDDVATTQPASQEKSSNKVIESLQVDSDCFMPNIINPVCEVSPDLGSPALFDSISTGTVSVSQNKELNDNFETDNVNLELEVIKPDMVQPSSSECPLSDGISYPSNYQMPHGDSSFVVGTIDDKSAPVNFREKNNCKAHYSDVSMVEDIIKNMASGKVGDSNDQTELPVVKERSFDDIDGPYLSSDKIETHAEERSEVATSAEQSKQKDVNELLADFSKRIDVSDGEHMEKVNLDQSSGDDSIEEDVTEMSHADFDPNTKKVEAETVLSRVTGVESSPEDKKNDTAFVEKRKFQNDVALQNQVLAKRQRSSNSDSLSIADPPNSSSSPSAISKDLFQTTPLNQNLMKVNSSFSGDASKERKVPPPTKSPTNSLRINNFLRPFTLKAVQELLEKTGHVCSFWMDNIKTHCYVTYSSVEEAIETRNAVYDLQWPPNDGRRLVAEFVDAQVVKSRLEAPSMSAAAPIGATPNVASNSSPIKQRNSDLQPELRHHGPPQPPVIQASPSCGPSRTLERLPQANLTPHDKLDLPTLATLDDLFKKTRATPRIYYLPLAKEQVAAKLDKQRRGK